MRRYRRQKSWGWKVLYSCLMPNKLIKKYSILYIICRGWMAKIIRKLNQTMLAREHRRPQTQLP